MFSNEVISHVAILSALLVASFSHAALAQDVAGDEAPTRNERAREAYLEGSAHFEAERYEEALAAFRRSYDYERLPALLFNMASALDRLNRPEQAIARYEAYLAAMEEDANAPYVRSRIRLLQAQVSEALEADGVDDEVNDIEISEDVGGQSDMDAPMAEPPSRVGPIVLFALGGAALAAAIGTGVRASGLDGDVRELCINEVCPESTEADARRVTRLARTTDAMAGVAGAAILGGVLWWVLSGGDEDAPHASAVCNTSSCEAQLRL